MKIGFGPSMSLLSFKSLSIVFGKNSSIRDTIPLAKSRILLWDRKFFVSYRTDGTLKLSLNWNTFLRS